jgi:hypothetical protein
MIGYVLLLVLVVAAMRPADGQTRCTNWETIETAFDEAKADWSASVSASPCYGFSYKFADFSTGDETKAVYVRDGVVVSGEGDMSINDFFDMIQS